MTRKDEVGKTKTITINSPLKRLIKKKCLINRSTKSRIYYLDYTLFIISNTKKIKIN